MASFTSETVPGPGPFDPGDNPDIDQQSAPVAFITSGNINFDDEEGQFTVPDNDLFGIFTDYLINNRFEKDLHRYMAGIASPSGFQGASVSFVQLVNPTLLWICDWTAKRLNSAPPIPDPTSRDSNWVLLDECYEPSMLGLSADGVTPEYRISGTYVYGHVNPDSTTLRNISFARPPWMKDSFDRTMSTGKLMQGLSEATGSSTLFTGS